VTDENVFVGAPELFSENPLGLDEPGIPVLRDLIDESGAEVLMVDTWRLLLG
jgi:hypothetical protein